MKIEFGNMTVKQAKELCENTEKCGDCPIQEYCPQTFNTDPCNFRKYEMEAEIDLPNEEDKHGAICPYPNCHYKNDHDRCLGCENAYK